MATPTIQTVCKAFHLLYSNLQSPLFGKTMDFHCWTERELLPLTRSFLLGYFREDFKPEATVRNPLAGSGLGRVNFMIGEMAVEFSVRNPGKSPSNMSPSTNASEVAKLIKHPGVALLVLFDFSDEPCENDIDAFRDLPSLGKGNHKTSAFNVAHYHRTPSGESDYQKINVRP